MLVLTLRRYGAHGDELELLVELRGGDEGVVEWPRGESAHDRARALARHLTCTNSGRHSVDEVASRAQRHFLWASGRLDDPSSGEDRWTVYELWWPGTDPEDFVALLACTRGKWRLIGEADAFLPSESRALRKVAEAVAAYTGIKPDEHAVRAVAHGSSGNLPPGGGRDGRGRAGDAPGARHPSDAARLNRQAPGPDASGTRWRVARCHP